MQRLRSAIEITTMLKQHVSSIRCFEWPITSFWADWTDITSAEILGSAEKESSVFWTKVDNHPVGGERTKGELRRLQPERDFFRVWSFAWSWIRVRTKSIWCHCSCFAAELILYTSADLQGKENRICSTGHLHSGFRVSCWCKYGCAAKGPSVLSGIDVKSAADCDRTIYDSQQVW